MDAAPGAGSCPRADANSTNNNCTPTRTNSTTSAKAISFSSILFAGVDTHVGDLGEVADDLTRLGRHLAWIGGRAGTEPIQEALAPQTQCVGACRQRRIVVGQQRCEIRVVARQRAHHRLVDASAAPSSAGPRRPASHRAGFRAATRSGRSHASCTAPRPGCHALRRAPEARARPGARVRTHRKWRPTWGNYARSHDEPD